MKLLINALTASIAFIAVAGASNAHAATLTIENQTPNPVALGEMRGIPLPSICERTGYGPCIEESFVRFRAYWGMSRIRGTASVEIEAGDRTTYLMLNTDSRLEIIHSCSALSQHTLTYVNQISGRVLLSQLTSESVCLTGPSATIVIDR